MLVSCDISGLEWVCAAYLSQDPVACKEIRDGFDQHEDNQKKLNLPSGADGRLLAKTFVFRLLYGGSAYAYAHDADFNMLSRRDSFWQAKIDTFYDKYKGIAQWHRGLMQEATQNGRISLPTGRFFAFSPYVNYKGEPEWPRTKILNYPVQGLGADLVMLARISLYRRLSASGISAILISSIHDSIIADCPEHEWKQVANMMNQVIIDIPLNFERCFLSKFNLPMKAKVEYGLNLSDTEIFTGV